MRTILIVFHSWAGLRLDRDLFTRSATAGWVTIGISHKNVIVRLREFVAALAKREEN